MTARLPHRRHDASGFSTVEVLVAALLLLVGAFASLSLLDRTAQATATGKQRDVANALAQELVERAQGGRYTQTLNDLVDVRPADALPGPADRLRAAMDPDADQAPSAVTPATPTSGTTPPQGAQSWTVRRRATTYTVSYRACTASDAYQQVTIAGPYDCGRPSTDPTGGDVTTSGSCRIGVLPATQPLPADPGTLTLRLQLLGLTGLEACVGAISQPLATGLCQLLGTSTLLSGLTATLLATPAQLTAMLGGLQRTGATLGLCPVSQVDQALAGATGVIGTSTRVTVTVSWRDAEGRTNAITQAAIVRRPA